MVQLLAVGDFYEDVLVELLAALGAALFLGNAYALVRRRQDRLAAVAAGDVPPPTATEAAADDPADELAEGDLAEAPVVRTIAYAALGFVVMVWGLASVFG
jgi:hypothetical protein